MATHRLPAPGSDSGVWGDILNDFLTQSHNTDGTLASNVVGPSQLQDSSVTVVKLVDGTITSSKLAGNIPSTKLATSVQASLSTADSSVQTVNGKSPTSGAVTLAAADVGALTQTIADARYADLNTPISSGFLLMGA
jgi:hypothetical protein